MPRLTDKQKKKIIADYVDSGNFCDVGRKNGVPESTVRHVVKTNKDIDVAKLCEEKKRENTQSTLEYMETQHETKKRILDKLLKAIEEKSDKIDMFTNVKDLATAYGILIDKELKYAEIHSKINVENSKEFETAKELVVKIRGLNNNE